MLCKNTENIFKILSSSTKDGGNNEGLEIRISDW
jgi:hypothetical protein